MKILQIITTLHIGGAEKLIVDIAPILRERGHEVEVLLLSGVETPFTNLLRLKGIVVHSLGEDSVYNPLLILKIIPYLKRFDVVHTHLFQPQYWTAFAKMLSFSKPKMITTEHNTTNRRRDFKLFKYIDKVVYKQYSGIISISEKADQMLQRYLSVCDDKYVVVHNGILLTQFKHAIALDKSTLTGIQNVDLIVKVAGFREQKDHATLIKSMLHLPVSTHLLLVGEGVCRLACETLSQSLGLTDRVHFLGVRTDIPAILKTADVVVMSSFYEGLSLSSVEGMAAGKPFVASNVDGLAEVIGGGGLLFERGDEKELAAHITKLLNDPVFYKEIADRCFKRAQQYDIEKMVDQYEDIYTK